jgi:hypothetical protein
MSTVVPRALFCCSAAGRACVKTSWLPWLASAVRSTSLLGTSRGCATTWVRARNQSKSNASFLWMLSGVCSTE